MNNPNPYILDGLHAIVHSTAVNPRRQRKPTLDAVKLWKERGSSNIFQIWSMEPSCHCISVAFITSTAFFCPDFDNEEMTNQTGFVIEAKPLPFLEDAHNVKI